MIKKFSILNFSRFAFANRGSSIARQSGQFSVRQRGQLSIIVLIFSSLAIIILSGLIIWVDSGQKAAYRSANQKLALMIAEAGIEYSRWHLAHAPNDFQDGTGQPGPYTHNYYDKDGGLSGQFILEITPPPINSSLVTIKSTGKVNGISDVEKIIQAQLGIPSVVKYAVLANSNIRFEPGTNVYGPIHANGGIHFDGVAYNYVTSARTTYNDPDHSGIDEYGVHTHTLPVDPEPPASPLSVRPDVFVAGREFPVPSVDFAGLTQTLAKIKSDAQSGGRYLGPSGEKGYHIVLKTNDTFDVYKVKKMMKKPDKTCEDTLKQKNWKTWSIKTAGSGNEQFIANYAFPANGLVFAEDHVWVDGQINTAKITIASGKFPYNPKTFTNIIIDKNLTYTNYDGQDVVGLIAQGNINVGMNSDDNLRIDAAVVAQNGNVWRYYYRPPSGGKVYCSPYHNRQSITLNGMIATNSGYGFAYTDGSGYQNRTIIYDSNLLYNPPPSFPFTSDYYQQISWKEIK